MRECVVRAGLIRVWCLALLFLMMACQKEDVVKTITVHLKDDRQIIRNFGASDAWSCQFVGLWPDETRNQIADWLFSKAFDQQGNPEGIGLSLWRFNIGAGSAEQSNVADEWRRAECFLKKDGTYDWTRQSGQQWFLHAAKSRGVEKYLAFTNSPPVYFTKNGNAFSENGEEANIVRQNYFPFAKFLDSVAIHFSKEGIAFDYISPFNEPQWDWTGSNQEGTPFKNSEIYGVTRILDSLLKQNKSKTLIQIAEAGKLNYLYENSDKPARGDQINAFFNNTSPFFVGDLTQVDKIISGHSYFTSSPVDTLQKVRSILSRKIKSASVPLEFWQSEYCILGDQEGVKATGKDLSIDPALYVSRIIHHDLTVANAAAWHWWLAVTPYDYKDGLIYVDKNKTDGKVEDTKLLWALGNFSRFIRPGAARVGITSDGFDFNNADGLMISSYVNMNQELVLVVINYGTTDDSLIMKIEDGEINSFKAYITGPGEDENLKLVNGISSDGKLRIPKRSIVTFVGGIK